MKRVLDERTSDEKPDLLEWIYQEMDDWDIFPVKLILPCLSDADGRVCCAAIKILSCLAGKGRLGREESRALLRMIGHPDSLVRETLVEMFRQTRFEFHRADLEELLPLLRHQNADMRGSAVRLFLEVPYHFEGKLCMKLADSAQREDLHIQATIYEFLEGLGQEHLLVIEQRSLDLQLL
ncbi:MAG: hypothetical protein VB050_10465 [Geobacteraceae bacterium]|nr:hypothetical protein [Geobacteraceae bacterium]